MSFDMNEMQVREARVRVFRAGKGQPLIYLHGAAGVPVWSPFMESLAQDNALIVPEHPGFGLSSAPKWMNSISDLALHYLDFLDAIGEERVAMVGHSLGGWIAAEIAVRNDTRLSSLTLIAPAGIRIKGNPVADNFMWSPEEAVRNLVHDQDLATQMLNRPFSDEEAEIRLTNQFTTARLGWDPRWYDPDLEHWLHRIGVPVQIIWGAEDRFIPPSYAGRWGDLIPGSRVEMIAAAGHLVPIEKPQESAAVIRKFVKGA